MCSFNRARDALGVTCRPTHTCLQWLWRITCPANSTRWALATTTCVPSTLPSFTRQSQGTATPGLTPVALGMT